MKHRTVSLHYCSACKSTTRHNTTDSTATCLRCGSVKHITRNVKPVTMPGRRSHSARFA